MWKKGRVVVAALATLGATALVVPEVQAGKPGGGGGAALDGGRIWYFNVPKLVGGGGVTLKSALASGKEVQSYPGLDFLWAGDYACQAEISRGTHGGKRWLVVHRDSAPRGILLVSEDGALQASISYDLLAGQARLRPHPATGAPDSSITWHGTTSAGTMGTYEAAVDWSTSPPTLAGATLLFDTGLAVAGYHDWSSDGRTIVYHGKVPVGSGTEFHLLRRTSSDSFAAVADLGMGAQPRVSSGASARIMFLVSGALWTTPLDGNGSSRSQLPGAGSRHLWSPNATSFAYGFGGTQGIYNVWQSVLMNVDGSASRELANMDVTGWVK